MLHVHWIFTKYIFLEIKATKSLSHAYKHSCQNNKITERKNIKKTLEIFRFYDNEGTIYCNNVASFKIVVREIKKINSIVTSSFNKCMFHFILIVCSIVFHAIVQNIGNAIFESFQSRQIFFCTKIKKENFFVDVNKNFHLKIFFFCRKIKSFYFVHILWSKKARDKFIGKFDC